jgi:hypothetical protein
VPLIDCATRAGEPSDCVSRPTEGWTQQTTGEAAAAQAAGAAYVATEDWFCVEGRCPGFVGSTPVTVEGTHLTVEFAQQLSALLAGAFPELASGTTDAPAPAGAGTGAPAASADPEVSTTPTGP